MPVNGGPLRESMKPWRLHGLWLVAMRLPGSFVADCAEVGAFGEVFAD